jgi:hypothetical protein
MDEDSETPTVIIIENQLENADDDHFKRCFSYAAAKGAKVIVWIVKDCSDEFRTIAEWFNDISLQTIRFYIVELKTVKIDDSKPAALFNVIVSPNATTKAERAKAASRVWNEDSFLLAVENKDFPDPESHPNTPQTVRRLYSWLKEKADDIEFGKGATWAGAKFVIRRICPKPIFELGLDGWLQVNYANLDEDTSQKLQNVLKKYLKHLGDVKVASEDHGKFPSIPGYKCDFLTKNIDAIIEALEEYVALFSEGIISESHQAITAT